MGALAALGLVLCARIAGDPRGPRSARAAAAAAARRAGAGVYLSFSRGAIGALAAGLAVLVVAARDRAQLRAAGLRSCRRGRSAGRACGASPGVRALEGDLGARETQGAGGAGAAAGAVRRRAAFAQRAARPATARGAPAAAVPRWALALAAVAGIGAVVGAAAAENRAERPGAAQGANAGAARVAAEQPLRLLGRGAARVRRPSAARRRAAAASAWSGCASATIAEPAQRRPLALPRDGRRSWGSSGWRCWRCSWPGSAGAARRALPATARWPPGRSRRWWRCALHAGLDWDWEMPALALVGIVLAGLLCGAADRLAAADPG